MFPDTPRVIYKHNPLNSVICQLRFPPILRIDTAPPAEFQERVRHSFPLLKDKAIRVDLPAGLPESLEVMLRSGGPRDQKAYDFISEDEVWTLGLTRDFLAISTSVYTRWEEFRERFAEPLEALMAVYKPASFIRIGLRYQNVIRRSRLGLEGASWPELLKPAIAGPLAPEDMSGRVAEYSSQMLIELPEELGKVRIRHGISQPEDNDGEECFSIDSDFFTDGRIGIDATQRTLDHFNGISGKLFRWCIRDRLHDAMGPAAVGRDQG